MEAVNLSIIPGGVAKPRYLHVLHFLAKRAPSNNLAGKGLFQLAFPLLKASWDCRNHLFKLEPHRMGVFSLRTGPDRILTTPKGGRPLDAHTPNRRAASPSWERGLRVGKNGIFTLYLGLEVEETQEMNPCHSPPCLSLTPHCQTVRGRSWGCRIGGTFETPPKTC